MSPTRPEVAALVAACEGRNQEARYLAYFECFNRGWFFEAHEVLEALWLPNRNQPNGDFYKGLIQVAGAFVHLQKDRSQPALALLRLARGYLRGYPAFHEGLDLGQVLGQIDKWIEAAHDPTVSPRRGVFQALLPTPRPAGSAN